MTTPDIQSLVESVKPVRDILGDPLVNNVPITPATQWIIDQQADLTRLRAELEIAKADIADRIERDARNLESLKKRIRRTNELEAELAEEKRKVEVRGEALNRFKQLYPNSPHIVRICDNALAALTTPSEGGEL